jgi:hypothetical protein
MDPRLPTDPHDKPASTMDIVAINIAWPCGLGVFTASLMTQNKGHALQGLALFFATFFYTLVRIYQLGRTDHNFARVVDRQATDPYSRVD